MNEPGNRAGDAFGDWSEVTLSPAGCEAKPPCSSVYKNTGDASIACQALEGRAMEGHRHIIRAMLIAPPEVKRLNFGDRMHFFSRMCCGGKELWSARSFPASSLTLFVKSEER